MFINLPRNKKRNSINRITSLMLLIFLLSGYYSFSQPVPTNDCATNSGVGGNEIIPTVGSCTPSASFTVNSAIGLPAGVFCSTAAGISTDGWVWFTATGTVTTITYSSIRDAVLWIYGDGGAPCVGLVEITCVDNGLLGVPETVTLATTIGNRYYVRIGRRSGAGTMAGTICVWTPNPPANDNCAGATVLAVGAAGAACTYTTTTNTGATLSAETAPGCANLLGADVWYKIVVAAPGNINIDTRAGSGVAPITNLTDGGMALYSGVCGALVLVACDDNSSANGGSMPYISAVGLAAGTYYIRVWANGLNSFGQFDICVTQPAAVCTGDNPCDASVPTLNAALACGTQQFAGSSNACATGTTGVTPNTPTCATFSYAGGDIWFKVVVPASGQLFVEMAQTGTMTDGMMALYSGACGALTQIGTYCDDDSGPGFMPSITATGLAGGTTIYVRIWGYVGQRGTFGMYCCDPCPGGAPANDNCTGAIALAIGGACPGAGRNNFCATPSPVVPNPGCANYQGGDVWFTVTTPAIFSGTLTFTGNAGTITDGAMAIYSLAGACPAGLTLLACDDDSGPGFLPSITLAGLSASTTYYIRYWKYGGGTGSFDICITDPCPSGPPPNDLPCNATFLPMSIFIPGSNQCASNVSDPATYPACFFNGSAGQINTVWYRFVALSSCTRIKTLLGTLTDTQIGVYSGAGGCGALGAPLACNDQYQPCAGGGTYNYSQIDNLATVAGTTYYIMVDGYAGLTGTFSIEIIDGGGAGCPNNFPPVVGQDCALPILICSPIVNVPNPGFQAIGNICDFPAPSPPTQDGNLGCSPGGGNPCTTSCLGSGERGSGWYTVTASAAGFLQFTITPNDSASGFETDYDFAVFGPNPSCGSLNTPIRCSYSALGETGLYGATANSAPPLYAPTYNGAFRERISMLPGEVYYIFISNFSNSTSGFHMDLGTSPIASVLVSNGGGTLIWSGAVSTDWNLPANWGGCQVPDCGINVVIPSFPANQPNISVIDASCRSINITPGASLTITNPRQLMVCNDYTNDGTLNAQNGTTVVFQDLCAACTVPVAGINHNQNLNGNMTGVWVGPLPGTGSRFNNVTVIKPNGFNVITNQNIDIGGDFLVNGSIGTGGFVATGKYHKVAGNFTVQTAPSITTYTPATTLEFNGTLGVNQTYYNRGLLDSVVMNQSGAGASVTLLNHLLPGTAWMQIGGAANAGVLTLTYGRIITLFSHASDNHVDVFNRSATAVSAGNINSYIEGTLRRSMPNAGGLGSYDFPVGGTFAGKGYERINFNLTTALDPAVNYWSVFFDGSVNPASPLFGVECGSNYHATKLALDHGIWTVQSNPTTLGAGIMNITNYNRNWANPLGAGWTVQYNNQANNAVANWLLNPFPAFPCAIATAATTLRNSMNVATMFSNPAQPVWFATAQSDSPLPVELLNFEAQGLKSSIKLKWATASEKDNKGFELERTITPPDNFEKMAWLNGHGSTTTTHYYDFEDKEVKQGITYYYRLKQVDYNGAFDYSKVVAANIGSVDFTFNVVPNPYSGSTNISYNLKTDSKVTIEVVNVMGQRVATLMDGTQEAGNYQFDFSAKSYGYSAGIYTVRILLNDQVYSKRILEKD